jgi:hypothetical protein
MACGQHAVEVTEWYEQIMKARMISESTIASWEDENLAEAIEAGKRDAYTQMRGASEEGRGAVAEGLARMFARSRESESLFSARKTLAMQFAIHSMVSFMLHREGPCPRDLLFSISSGLMLSRGMVPTVRSTETVEGEETTFILDEDSSAVRPLRLTDGVQHLLASPRMLGLVRTTMGNALIGLVSEDSHIEVR